MPYASDKRHGPAAKPAAAAKAAAAGGRKGAGNPAGAPPGKGSAAAAAAAKPADGVAPARKGAGASRGPAGSGPSPRASGLAGDMSAQGAAAAKPETSGVSHRVRPDGSGPSPRAGGLAGDMSAQGAAAAKPETSGVSHRVRPDGSGPSPRAGGSAGDMGAQGAAAAKPETSGVSQRVRPSGEGSPDGSGPSPRAGGLAGGIAPSGAQGAAAAKPEKSGVSHRARPGGAGGSGNPEGSGPSPRAGGMAGPSGAHGAAAAKPEKSGVSHRGRPGGAGDPLESSRPADGSEPDSSELNRRFEGQDSSDIAAAAPPPGDWVTRDESDLVQIGAETSEEDPGGVFMTGVPASPPAHARKRTNRPVLSPLTAGGGSHTPQPPTRTESSSPVRRHPRAGHQGDDKAEKVVFIPKAPSIPSGDGANKLPELVVSQCEANDESDEAAAKEAVEGDVLSKFEGVLRERGTAKHKQKEIRATQLAAMQEKLRSAREDVDKRMQQDLEDRAAAEAERERERTAKRAVREDARQRRIRALGLRTAEGKYGHLPLHEAMSARYHCEVVVPAMEEQREKLRELRRKFDAPTDAQVPFLFSPPSPPSKKVSPPP
ncbi:hypothetical protein DIPPA_02445 [Diplonema papillatum]|nr:hypothetical protein DIPPA_02445 [Diplonema papillatum]